MGRRGPPAPSGGTSLSTERLVEVLVSRGLRLAVAESCTGGLLGAAVTAVPGASRTFLGGVLAYHDDAKVNALGVDAGKIKRVGSVSAAVVEAMAHGVRDRFHSDVAIAVSGIAGPDGGTKAKPVGTVWVAVLGPGHLLEAKRIHVDGDREAVRQGAVREATRIALELLEEARLEA